MTTTPRDDRGITTAEYAVGTAAGAGFAGLLYKLLTGSFGDRVAARGCPGRLTGRVDHAHLGRTDGQHPHEPGRQRHQERDAEGQLRGRRAALRVPTGPHQPMPSRLIT